MTDYPAHRQASGPSRLRFMVFGLAVVMGHVEHGQVVLGVQDHPEPFGEHHMVIGEYERHYVGHGGLPSVL